MTPAGELSRLAAEGSAQYRFYESRRVATEVLRSRAKLEIWRAGATLEAEVAEAGVVVWTAAQGPVVFAITLADRGVVDAGDAATHQAVRVEVPELIAVGPEPGAAVVAPLIGEAHRDAILAKTPQF